MNILFSLTLFVSAFLLFTVELYFAKMLVPILGGVPAVWNTCMVFFQAMLLAAYLYAHFLSGRASRRKQCLIHGLVLLIPLALLPVRVPHGWLPPLETYPVGPLLGLLAWAVGLPFFALATTAPLLQKWFSYSRAHEAKDPYFLYAASNAGSFAALLGYPFLIEPTLTLSQQSMLWSVGYGALLVLLLVCLVKVWNIPFLRPPIPKTITRPPVSATLRWVALALVPSSLLLGLTTYIATDVASIPLIWIAPLGMYLLTFVLAFSRFNDRSRVGMVRLFPMVIILLSLVLSTDTVQPMRLILPLHFLAFFVISLVFHGELARSRPEAARLTEFYVWLAVGGVAGGALNALVAPLVFDWPMEYPLMICGACFIFIFFKEQDPSRMRAADWAVMPIMGLSLWSLNKFLYATDWQQYSQGLFTIVFMLIVGVPAFICFYYRRRPAPFAIAVTLCVFTGLLSIYANQQVLLRERGFFGCYRVTQEKAKDGQTYRYLYSGTTIHGIQSAEAAREKEALSYFHDSGPVGGLFQAAEATHPLSRVAVVGLGIGTLLLYSHEGQVWDLYEIDPLVKKIALDERYFTFLRDARASYEIILGDGRLTIAGAPERAYDMIFLDAFSSDSIPLHLLTREAIALYLSRLKEDGLLIFQISNRHLKLGPVLARAAEVMGLEAIARHDVRTPEDKKMNIYDSKWVVLSRRRDMLERVLSFPGWQVLEPDKKSRVWTDDFSNLFQAL